MSSDPAHSLGDALQERFTGTPRRIEDSFGSSRSDSSSSGSGVGGELWAMEIDPARALTEFQEIVQDTLQKEKAGSGGDGSSSSSSGSSGGATGGGFMSALGMPNLSAELADLLFSVKDPPPGTDEIVALTKIVDYLDNGCVINGRRVQFDRVVLDTAPTGHTLRMLQLPKFMQQMIKKLRVLRDKTKVMSMGGIMGMLGGSGGAGAGAGAAGKGVVGTPDSTITDATGAAVPKLDRLTHFELQMQRLEIILHSPKDCEFTAVTIPTELATAETKRLLDTLSEENILVRRLIVNQIMPSYDQVRLEQDNASVSTFDPAAVRYMDKLRTGQEAALTDLRLIAQSADVPLVQVPYLDTEVRSVYGLRVIKDIIFPVSDKK